LEVGVDVVRPKGFFLLFTFVFLPALWTPVQCQEEYLLQGLGVEAHGFLDIRGGMRTQDDPNERDTCLGEVRLQTDVSRMGDRAALQVRADFLYDDVAEETDLDLEDGTGVIDLREANVLFSPCTSMDMKVGRQILTWGTGDLLFINDLFPKDWQSFFIGREEEYLKAPSDTAFVSLFPAFASIDLAYTPRFDADRYISGERLSYWDPMSGERSGRDNIIDADKPDDWFRDDEIAVRVYRHLAGYELALYGYNGFWKSPKGMDPETERATFHSLWAYGASLQGPLAAGLLNFEIGHYVSDEDRSGKDAMVPNGEMRLLVGYERELARNLTAKFQYYLEYMEDYENYKASLPEGQRARDEARHVLTLRLAKLAFNQNMTLSLFAYFSPSDEDAYLRPMIKYKVTDSWLVMTGGNIFAGEADHTFFGQFEKNTNVYGALRYSF
jgi:hypothetical protein